MKKITDRFFLGVISGLGGNIAKMGVEHFFKNIGFSKETGAEKAAGIFLKKSDISKPYGKAVGVIADNMIAAGLGITCAYWLTVTGKDKYLLKGAGLGAAEWTALYGVLSSMGATQIYPSKPQDTLVSFLSHTAFGLTKIEIMTQLADERLFKPKNLTHKIDKPQEITITKEPEHRALRSHKLNSKNRRRHRKY